jgi:O-antigen/teichoic acid export membrane protein
MADETQGAAPGRLRRWFRKLSSAVGEQAFFSGGSFIFNILLARFLSAEEYGAFAVAYVWFTLILNLHDGFIVEPMSIFGAGKYGGRLRDYLGFVFLGEGIFVLIAAALLGLGAVVSLLANSTLVGHALLGVTIAAPFLLPRWLTRQPFYIMGTPGWAALGSAMYAVVVVGGVLLLEHFNVLTPISAFLVMGAGGLIASTFLTVALIRPRLPRKDSELKAGQIWRDHWRYARWGSTSNSLNWVSTNVIPVISPLLIGLSGTGALRAMNVVMMPLYLSVSAVMGIALPTFSRAFVQGGKARLNAYARNIAVLVTGASAVYCVLMTIFGVNVIDVLFKGQYNQYITVAILGSNALVQVLYASVLTLDVALRSMGKIRQSFVGNLIPSVISWTLGVWLMYHYGILGMNIGLLFTYCVVLVVLVTFYRRAGHTQEAPSATVPA